MIAALKYNASKKEEKAQSIDLAIQNKHNGDVIDKLDSQFPEEGDEDNNKIIHHIFGKNTEAVTQDLSSKSGVDKGKIAGILAILAPIVMGYIGKQKSGQGNTGIGDIIGNILSGNNNSAAGDKAPLEGLGDLVSDFFNKEKDSNSKGIILDKITNIFR